MNERVDQVHRSHARVQTDSVAQAEDGVAGGTVYTCPMHPQIRRNAPGNCPICGMALEPVMPSLEEERNPELEDFTRRFWWTLPLTIAGVAIAMGGHRLAPIAPQTMSWVELALATPVVLWAGFPFFVRCVESNRRGNPNMWTLIGIGVAAAYIYSLLGTVAPGLFPDAFREGGRVAVYFEAAAVIVSLTLLSDRCWSSARARRLRPRFVRCSGCNRKPRAASRRTGRRRTFHSRTCTSATCCACGRAKRCRWTA